MTKTLQAFLVVLAVAGAFLISTVWFSGLIQSAPSDGETGTEVLARISMLIYQPMAAGVLAFGLYTAGALAALRDFKKFTPGVILWASLALAAALVLTFIWEYSRVYLLPNI